MMVRLRSIFCNQRGASAVEFALLAPVLFSIIIGAAQMGILFFANAGLQHAIGEGARLAMIFPRPTVADIQEKVRTSRYGMDPDYVVGDPVVTIVDDNGPADDYADISWSYRAPLNFIFFDTRPVTLNHTRRAYLQGAASAPPAGGGGTGGGATTGGTTTGGTTTGSTGGGTGTTTGGTTSGSTTSGGTTSGGSTTTGGDTSTSSTSGGSTTTTSTGGGATTSSGSGGASSGGGSSASSSGSGGGSSGGGSSGSSSGNGKGSDKVKGKK
jgi:Flp pilus assembly protein TadG